MSDAPYSVFVKSQLSLFSDIHSSGAEVESDGEDQNVMAQVSHRNI